MHTVLIELAEHFGDAFGPLLFAPTAEEFADTLDDYYEEAEEDKERERQLSELRAAMHFDCTGRTPAETAALDRFGDDCACTVGSFDDGTIVVGLDHDWGTELDVVILDNTGAIQYTNGFGIGAGE